MGLVFLIVLILFGAIVHELEHARILRRYGGEIEELGVGFNLPPRITLQATEKRPYRIILSPWLIGAYVKPDRFSREEILPRLSLAKHAHINGAGVQVNLMMAGVFALFGAVREASLGLAILGALLMLPMLFGRAFALILPFVGIGALVLLVQLIGQLIAQDRVQMITAYPEVGQQVENSGMPLEYWGFGVMLGLAALNMIPIYPLDGGQTMDLYLQRVFRKWVPALAVYRVLGLLVLVGLFVFLLVGDVRTVF